MFKKALCALLASLLTAIFCVLPALALTDNAHSNGYGWNWAHPVRSYLVPLDDGTYLCLNAEESLLTITYLSADGEYIGEQSTMDYSPYTFAGFFAGEEYYFVAASSSNPDESDEKTVLTVIKYDKSFNRLGITEFKGENTYVAVDAGSLRMTETAGRLYVHTCHTMYKTEDGLHHQANMTFVIDEASMRQIDGFSGIMNIGWGYASHSFNQFIGTDGEYIYRVDHGDAFPRGISVTRAAVGGSVTDVDYCVPIVFDGQTGDNSTAVETGGFAVGERNLLIAWMHYNDDGTTSYYLLAVAKDLSDFKLIEVGGAAEGLTAFNPMLVPLENGNYLYMYEMYPPRQPVTDIICTIVDEDGNAAGEPLAIYGTSLSDCQPVYCPDGIVRWTVVEDGKVTLYSCDPLSEAPDYVPGDVNGNGKIDSADYAMCKRAFLRTYVLNDDQFTRADINKNSRLDAAEYAMIKRHFLKTYTIPGAAGK
ncbi:MAG: dockerin type I repeat-containing protein [Clostridia bacterium]|nr:dockerin type I repeat-containing protein [Clostridia bacterium]